MCAKEIKLIIDSDLDDVFLIGLAVNKICEHVSMNDVESYQMEVCVVEAVNNAIRHAYLEQKGKRVEVIVGIYEKQIGFEVHDWGTPMPDDVVDNTPSLSFDPDDHETLPESGMGLFIIHEVMDSVAYEKREGGMNALMCRKELSTELVPDV